MPAFGFYVSAKVKPAGHAPLSFFIFVLVVAPLNVILGEILFAAATVNLGFFVFNMIPVPPLDGSRVLYALAPEFVRRGMETIERYGLMFVFIIVLLASSVIGSFMSSAIQFFLVLFARIFGIGLL